MPVSRKSNAETRFRSTTSVLIQLNKIVTRMSESEHNSKMYHKGYTFYLASHIQQSCLHILRRCFCHDPCTADRLSENKSCTCTYHM